MDFVHWRLTEATSESNHHDTARFKQRQVLRLLYHWSCQSSNHQGRR